MIGGCPRLKIDRITRLVAVCAIIIIVAAGGVGRAQVLIGQRIIDRANGAAGVVPDEIHVIAVDGEAFFRLRRNPFAGQHAGVRLHSGRRAD